MLCTRQCNDMMAWPLVLTGGALAGTHSRPYINSGYCGSLLNRCGWSALYRSAACNHAAAALTKAYSASLLSPGQTGTLQQQQPI
jgi:hypothetical protein